MLCIITCNLLHRNAVYMIGCLKMEIMYSITLDAEDKYMYLFFDK